MGPVVEARMPTGRRHWRQNSSRTGRGSCEAGYAWMDRIGSFSNKYGVSCRFWVAKNEIMYSCVPILRTCVRHRQKVLLIETVL